MKLSEVIKAIEDGSKSKFENGFLTLKQCEIMRSIELGYSNIDLAINFDGWKEVKPPRQWSEKELMLFKLLPDWAKWIGITGLKIVIKEFEKNTRFAELDKDTFSFLSIKPEEGLVYMGDMKGD
jgi:hypothetical protein